MTLKVVQVQVLSPAVQQRGYGNDHDPFFYALTRPEPLTALIRLRTAGAQTTTFRQLAPGRAEPQGGEWRPNVILRQARRRGRPYPEPISMRELAIAG